MVYSTIESSCYDLQVVSFNKKGEKHLCIDKLLNNNKICLEIFKRK